MRTQTQARAPSASRRHHPRSSRRQRTPSRHRPCTPPARRPRRQQRARPFLRQPRRRTQRRPSRNMSTRRLRARHRSQRCRRRRPRRCLTPSATPRPCLRITASQRTPTPATHLRDNEVCAKYDDNYTRPFYLVPVPILFHPTPSHLFSLSDGHPYRSPQLEHLFFPLGGAYSASSETAHARLDAIYPTARFNDISHRHATSRIFASSPDSISKLATSIEQTTIFDLACANTPTLISSFPFFSFTFTFFCPPPALSVNDVFYVCTDSLVPGELLAKNLFPFRFQNRPGSLSAMVRREDLGAHGLAACAEMRPGSHERSDAETETKTNRVPRTSSRQDNQRAGTAETRERAVRP